MTHQITVIGSGFGALSSVRELRKRDAQAEITLIAPRAELHYLPGIIWISCGLRSRKLICIIDAIDHGTVVFRNAKHQIILPSSRLFHWVKRGFELVYLRRYR